MSAPASDDMVRGYMAGLNSTSVELPACHANRSAAFRHGWISGRNDRHPELAERYDVRMRRANMILGSVMGCVHACEVAP